MDLFGDEPIEEIEDDIDDDAAAEPSEPENIFAGPRLMNFVKGHDDVEKSLLELYNSGRMPHALIFTGPKGIGKNTMAFRFAKFLFKNGIKDPNQSSMFGDESPTSLETKPDDPAVRKLLAGAHPDFLLTEKKFDEAKGKQKDSLDIEEIRKVAPFLRMTSSEGGWRVVIVDDADDMTIPAQNALLKILEEPPKNTVLILIAHRAGALIPTIRSRSRTINFAPLGDKIIKDLLSMKSPAPSSRETELLTRLSGGSFGKALDYAEAETVKTLDTLYDILNTAPNWPWLRIHKLADTLSGPGSDPAFYGFRELIEWSMRQTARSRARGTAPPDGLQTFLKNSSLEELLKICENLENHFDRADYANLDRRQAVLGAFSLIAA